MSKREEIAEAKRLHKVLNSSLELGAAFEDIRRKYKLTLWQCVEVLRKQEQLYLNIAIHRVTRGRH